MRSLLRVDLTAPSSLQVQSAVDARALRRSTLRCVDSRTRSQTVATPVMKRSDGLLLSALAGALLLLSQTSLRGSTSSRRILPDLPLRSLVADKRTVLPDHVLGEADGTCPVSRNNTEYGAAEVITWGSQNLQPDAAACCSSCAATPRCNTWVYCNDQQGCSGGSRPHGECWLKHSSSPALPVIASRGQTVGWTSGAIFGASEAAEAAAIALAEEAERDAIRFAPGNPQVFLDVSIDGAPAERMVFTLFANTSPRWAENFLGLCRGDSGVAQPGAEGAGRNRTFVGAKFYRILDQFIDQAGAGTDSVFGGSFKDDPGGLELKHNRRGLLSAANGGPDTNTSHFSILMAPAPHLDGSYTIFGELISGWEVAAKINLLATPSGTPSGSAIIVGAGQLT